MRIAVLPVALACLGQAAGAFAAVTAHDTLFTSVCTDEQITGFEWHDGGWVPAKLYPNRYTVQKRDSATIDCMVALKAAPAPDPLFSDVSLGCYTLADFGNSPGPALACSETWTTDDAGTEALTNVNCASPSSLEWIVFDPTGAFQYTQLVGSLTAPPRDNTQDALAVSIGKCKFGRPPGLYPPGSAGPPG